MKTTQIIDTLIHEMGQVVFDYSAGKISKECAEYTLRKLGFTGQTIAAGNKSLTYIINATKSNLLQKL